MRPAVWRTAAVVLVGVLLVGLARWQGAVEALDAVAVAAELGGLLLVGSALYDASPSWQRTAGKARAALRRLAWWREPQVVTAAGRATIGGPSAEGQAVVGPPPFDPAAPVGERIAWLVKRAEQLEGQITGERQRATRKEQQLRRSIEKLQEQLTASTDELRVQIKRAAIPAPKERIGWALAAFGFVTRTLIVPLLG